MQTIKIRRFYLDGEITDVIKSTFTNQKINAKSHLEWFQIS